MVITRNQAQNSATSAYEVKHVVGPTLAIEVTLHVDERINMEDFGELFLQLANILKPVDLPEFHGYNHEDPEEFLVRLTGTFAKHAITEEKWTITAAGQLREEAKTWWVPYEHVGLTFLEFETSLRERFNNPALVAKLTAELYNKRQKEDEAVEIFLIKKQQLFRRTLKDLKEAASYLERTVRRPATATKTADVHRVAATPTFTTRTASRQGLTDPPRYRREQESPPKCWYCPGYHYNKHCPERPEPEQGNAKPAGGRRTHN
ncbi:hypothetical protein HHI36_016954 [Cryptolaemus montrouzieri]|uniref:Retrotransposon gag domain-containing protein n=1 Tax=Cryptolaemus montrouzieri TaxID=559131 RepID=A0ABD2NL91_9CUCU